MKATSSKTRRPPPPGWRLIVPVILGEDVGRRFEGRPWSAIPEAYRRAILAEADKVLTPFEESHERGERRSAPGNG